MLKKADLLVQTRQISSRQWGHVTHQQLLALGIPRTTIQSWVTSGYLVRVHRGVYALGHAEKNSWARACAAVLAAGHDALLSRSSAIALWGVRDWPPTPEVCSPHSCRKPGIRHHRTGTLTPADTTRYLNIPTTTLARAILDLQPRLTDRQLIRLINDARLRRVLSATQLQRLLERSTRVAGLIDPTQRPTRSGFEDDFAAFCRRYRLPIPQINATVAGHEVDALFPDHKVIVEIDSWKYHRTRQSFISDRQRDLATTAAGHITVRIPDDGLTAPTAAHLHEVLAQRI